MTRHDPKTCIFCQFLRGILVVGMCAIAVVMFVASMDSMWHGHLAMSLKELVAVPLCLVWAWLGLKALDYLNKFFDWGFDKIEAKLNIK
jgi:hypothetical protein